MALTPGSICETDTVGSRETITLSPIAPSTATQATIASAFYGVDTSGVPLQAAVAPDQKSLSINVLSGINSLVVTLVSPGKTDEMVALGQGTNIFATPTIQQHSAVSTLYVKGI